MRDAWIRTRDPLLMSRVARWKLKPMAHTKT